MTLSEATIQGQIEITSSSAPHNGSFQGMSSDLSVEDLAKRGYVLEEYVICGDVDGGEYRTVLIFRRPVDPVQFSGLVVMETLHVSGHMTIWPSYFEHILRQGHGHALIVSQKTSLDDCVRPTQPERYGDLAIPTPTHPGIGTAGLPGAMIKKLGKEGGRTMGPMIANTPNSLSIIGQAGALLKTDPSLFGSPTQQLVLTGISQTGGQTIAFVEDSHSATVLSDGSSVFDGYMPHATFSGRPLPASGVPIVHVVDEAELLLAPPSHRRPDGDTESDLFRLYELPGCPHFPTRGMSTELATALTANSPVVQHGAVEVSVTAVLSQFPLSMLYRAAFEAFIKWVTDGIAPAHADPVATDAAGKIHRDEHGNAIGGVRFSYLEVPTARYIGTFVGYQESFDVAKLHELYGDEAHYAARVEEVLSELEADGFLLPADSAELLEEARSFRFEGAH